jgi:hypothetical protein
MMPRLSLQTIKESRQGYERLGVQVAELLTAVMSVLQRPEPDATLVQAIQTNVDSLMKYVCHTSPFLWH